MGTLVDCFFSRSGKYAYHWDRRIVDGAVFRHDNAPHVRWQHIHTFPKHFHDGSDHEDAVRESTISDDPVAAIGQFLTFVRERLSAQGHDRQDAGKKGD